jgi:predicted Ser/Thr protein kinase/flagellar basal body-associated protein FliL
MEVPKKLGKYEIRRELGKGAMGVVYEGYDPGIERIVALKTIRADQLGGEDAPDIIVRFRREAQAAGRLTHPQIVAVYEYGEDAGTTFIAMEFVKGRSLKDDFERHARFPMQQVVRIMTELLAALDYSHRQGVVHRDIKPANIMLLEDGSVKVADFGIARIESSNLTQTGMILGTPSYMSPEQFMGQTVDGRSDLFSAGVILYQLLTGERPFSGSPTTIMQKVLQENPLPPSHLNVQVPRPFDQIVKRALEKRPEDRFQSAREFAEAIRTAVAARPAQPAEPTVLSTASRPGEQTVVAAPSERTQKIERTIREPAAPQPAAAPAAKKSQSAAIAVIASVVVIGIAAVAGYALWGTSRGPAKETPTAAAPPAQPVAPPAAATSAPTAAVPAVETSKTPPGTIVVTAVGIVDPSDARYKADNSLLQSDLRADSRSQAVEKALGLYLESSSLAKNYEVLRDKLLSKSGTFIADVVQESEPRTGKDGLMSLTTKAVVNVKALQKSLNQMSREERIEFIRTNGDPKVAVRVSVRDADNPAAPAQNSPIAENLLKERIKSFGFRTWSEEGASAADAKSADFTVVGEARVKRLSAKLAASGLTVTKFTLSSWTVKCIDRQTGEEIYFNNTLPKGVGSWASEEEALQAIGTKIADEFSRDFFLQNFPQTGQKVTLKFDGLPDAVSDQTLTRELAGLPAVLSATPRSGAGSRLYDLVLAGPGAASDIVAGAILRPLNAKLGQACFRLGAIAGAEATVGFDKACADPSVLGRLETNPPAALYAAPVARTKSIVKNPETLKKLSI